MTVADERMHTGGVHEGQAGLDLPSEEKAQAAAQGALAAGGDQPPTGLGSVDLPMQPAAREHRVLEILVPPQGAADTAIVHGLPGEPGKRV